MTRSHPTRRRVLATVSVLAAALASVVTLGVPAQAETTATISRSLVIYRAQSWITAGGYPYSQTAFTPTGWRTDCSGYVSMAWDVAKSENGGTNTVGLRDNYSYAITKDNLLAGDILIDTTGDSAGRHVVLFHKWADAARTKYYGFEQSAPGSPGTKWRVIAYPYDKTPAEYFPRRAYHVV